MRRTGRRHRSPAEEQAALEAITPVWPDAAAPLLASGLCAAGVVNWVERAHGNLKMLGARQLRFTPRSAVLWWFVPFANWALPYRAMTEIWRASRDPAAWPERSTSWLLPAWWVLWLLADNLVLFTWLGPEDVTWQDLDRDALLRQLAELASVPAAGLLMAVTIGVWRAQRRSHERGDREAERLAEVFA